MDTQEPPPSLLSLPNELLARIVEWLWRWRDAAALSHTCKRLRWLAQEVFRRWDLNWEEERAWLCFTRPDQVAAIEVTRKRGWRDWWKRVCDTGTWDLLEWLAAQPVMSGLEDIEVWEDAWRCAKHEDGVRGLRWAVEHFGAPFKHSVDASYAEQRWACKALPFLMDEVGVEVDVQKILAYAKHEATVTFLVDRGAQVESVEGLVACSACGDTEGVERALAVGVDVNSVADGRRDRRTSLHVAKDGEMVRLLVSCGANLEARNLFEETSLLVAIEEGRLSAVVALQECGADAQARDRHGRTALHLASERGDKEMLIKCLEWGLDVNWGDDAKPLHLARDGETVHLLVAHGADVDAQNRRGNTPLPYATPDGRLSAMEALRACGADIEVRHRGSTLLHVASLAGRPKAVAMLLKWGLQVDARAEMHQTPLHRVVILPPSEARVECARVLLAHGANPEARDEEGEGVRDWAETTGWPDDLILRLFDEG